MNLIKLNATSSTNDYLKELAVGGDLPNFTVAVAEHQTKGKGQRGNTWNADSGKNLTFSILIHKKDIKSSELFTLNVMVANSILSALKSYNLDELYIKWPNDILSYNKKIGGILIENNFRSNGSLQSIIGIGINLLQENFEHLPKASSVLMNYGLRIDKMDLLTRIVENLKRRIANYESQERLEWSYYHYYLYKKNKPMTFEDAQENRFMGMIQSVTHSGLLQIEKENGMVYNFDLKEIKMLY